MCSEGGFNSIKFICNNKKFLQSVPEKERQSGVKDEDLFGDLSKEQDLGVLWKTNNDALGFKASIKNKPMAKRGTFSILSSVYNQFGFGAPFLLKGKRIL